MLKLEELCTQVQQIARQAGAFLKEERRKFDRARVEEKSAHNSTKAATTGQWRVINDNIVNQ